MDVVGEMESAEARTRPKGFSGLELRLTLALSLPSLLFFFRGPLGSRKHSRKTEVSRPLKATWSSRIVSPLYPR